MKTKPLIIFVSILSLISAIIFFTQDRPFSGKDPREGKKLVDPLILRETTSLVLHKGDRTVTLQMLDDDAHWIVSEYFDFPINFQNLTRLGSALDKAKIKQFTTSNPERLERLQFGKERIEIFTTEETPALTLHLGKTVSNRGRFVRFNDEERAYLSDLTLFVDIDSKSWAADSLTNLVSEQIAEFSIEIPEEKHPLLFTRSNTDAQWEIASQKNEGETPLEDDINNILKKMMQLRFVETTTLDHPDVIDAAQQPRTIRLKTFEGHSYTIRIGKTEHPQVETVKDAEGNIHPVEKPHPVYVWINSSDPADPINELMTRRAFIISTYLFIALPTSRDSLIKNIQKGTTDESSALGDIFEKPE
ncbi:MAG: DUF4340 domain-containing protein [Opitutaceae bacterium]|nr:DUF4340 domain-containing protein [Opitutaceae bacterium]